MSLLGIDIGGTKTVVAIADDSGKIIAQSRLNTPREQGPTVVLAEIERSVRGLLTLHSSLITSVGIACGGPLDPQRGVILTVPNLPGWENLPLADYFSKAFGAPAYLDNDVNLAALAEARKGAGVGIDHLAYFNIGTGIGGGIVIGGRLYRGCGNAGEFGHQIIVPDGPPCLCGKRGCLESLASGTSIARRASESGFAGSAEDVASAAREGDSVARRIMDETAQYLGLGVANVVNILNPRMVILGGGVMKAADLLLDRIGRTVDERAMTQLAKDVQIVPGVLGDQAGITGAVLLAMEA
jgi:glucokinase